jgi:glucose-1-phosphate cytidylyltransferase
MKVVILAGGLGTRIAEETHLKPKPMVEIGGKPILWHIMKLYSAHGLHDFVICCGYKGYVIKEYFANYVLHTSDVTLDLKNQQVELHSSATEPWRVTLVDTGEGTATGGRLKRVAPYLDGDDFCFTYGDAVADVDLHELIRFHRRSGALATVTATRPPGRFGALGLGPSRVESFQEKPLGDGGWINGGFFVVSPRALEYIDGDATVWEHEPLERLTREGNLAAFTHGGFWHPMDTLRDKNHLEELWAARRAPWQVWGWGGPGDTRDGSPGEIRGPGDTRDGSPGEMGGAA